YRKLRCAAWCLPSVALFFPVPMVPWATRARDSLPLLYRAFPLWQGLHAATRAASYVCFAGEQ
ncbi:MAG TPA: hypothetical protein VN627_04530, partial [Novosphingobium sp.]|nr:hypothetical protein [Novosphingobium sp.]